MATLTNIEEIPKGWQDGFGDGWSDLGIDPVESWLELFAEWVSTNYPGLHVSGKFVLGPATCRFPNATNIEPDTPKQEKLPPLPESLWGEFQSLTCDNWQDLIQGWHTGHEIDMTDISSYRFSGD